MTVARAVDVNPTLVLLEVLYHTDGSGLQTNLDGTQILFNTTKGRQEWVKVQTRRNP